MLHEKAMMPINGHEAVVPFCCRRKWPYHASVMKMLLKMSSRMVCKLRSYFSVLIFFSYLFFYVLVIFYLLLILYFVGV